MRESRASFKQASEYLISQKIDESILDNFDELSESLLDDIETSSVKAASQIDKDVFAKYSCSVLIVLNVKNGYTATNTDIHLVSERLSEIAEQSRLFKNSSLTSIIMESTDSDTGEVIDEELDPTNIRPGYKTLVDFFKRTDHKGLYVTIPDAYLMFEISFEPRLGLSLDRYADSLRRFMDRVQSTVTRSSKDHGYLKFFVYSKPNLSCTFPMFRPLAPVIIIDSYELIYDTDLDIKPEDLGEDVSSHAREQFTRDVPRLLDQSVSLNERMQGRHGVWIEYESFRWIAPRSFLICAHVRRRFQEEPVSVTNVLFVLTQTLFAYLPDSIILDNAVCVSVTADETIDEVNNKTSQLGRPDQTRIDDNIHINTSARPECMDLRDSHDKEVRSNRFIRVMLSKGDSMKTDSFPVGVIFPQKNGYISQKWYDLKVRYAGTVRHREWFQPFIETKLTDD